MGAGESLNGEHID
jgi:Ca2+-binding EF-hand superfamily protein